MLLERICIFLIKASGFIILIPFAALLAVMWRPVCHQEVAYSFDYVGEDVILEDGATATLNFEFYPHDGQKMSFHDALEDKVTVETPEKIAHSEEPGAFERRSAKSRIFIDESSPLQLAIGVTRTDLSDGRAVLDFGPLGQTTSYPGAGVDFSLVLRRSELCYLNSENETFWYGFSSDRAMLRLE